MKKLFTLLFVATAMSFVACGPNAEQAAEEEAKAKAAEQAKMDSVLKFANESMTTDTMHADTTAAPAPAAEEKK
jgi:hypothetical protein